MRHHCSHSQSLGHRGRRRSLLRRWRSSCRLCCPPRSGCGSPSGRRGRGSSKKVRLGERSAGLPLTDAEIVGHADLGSRPDNTSTCNRCRKGPRPVHYRKEMFSALARNLDAPAALAPASASRRGTGNRNQTRAVPMRRDASRERLRVRYSSSRSPLNDAWRGSPAAVKPR